MNGCGRTHAAKGRQGVLGGTQPPPVTGPFLDLTVMCRCNVARPIIPRRFGQDVRFGASG